MLASCAGIGAGIWRSVVAAALSAACISSFHESGVLDWYWLFQWSGLCSCQLLLLQLQLDACWFWESHDFRCHWGVCAVPAWVVGPCGSLSSVAEDSAGVAAAAFCSATTASAWSTACAAARCLEALAGIAFEMAGFLSRAGPTVLLAGNVCVIAARVEAALFAIIAITPGMAGTTAVL